MKKNILITALFCMLASPMIHAQMDTLKEAIEQLIKTKKAQIGVSIYRLEKEDALNINNEQHFPLQSVFKFPIALTVLHEVDKGNLSLDQKIYISKHDLLPNTWSPIREKYPNGEVHLPLSEIIKYMVAESDNNGCDILLRLIGGTTKVNDYMHKIGIKEMEIAVNEEEMHKEWDIQFLNWTTPNAATELLKVFYDQKILSPKSYAYLWKVMSATVSGKNRIKGQLPPGTIVAHKTGTSDTNEQGLTAALNDIGIVTLPNGQHFAISVFVSNSSEDEATNEQIIADISKMAWDYFAGK